MEDGLEASTAKLNAANLAALMEEEEENRADIQRWTVGALTPLSAPVALIPFPSHPPHKRQRPSANLTLPRGRLLGAKGALVDELKAAEIANANVRRHSAAVAAVAASNVRLLRQQKAAAVICFDCS